MDYIEFTNKSVEEFQEIQNEFRDTYKIDDYANWYYNQATFMGYIDYIYKGIY